MKWGLITDTHDHDRMVESAISIFEEARCTAVFHCGDFNSQHIFDMFMNRRFRFFFVTDHSSHDSTLADVSVLEKINDERRKV